MPINLGQTPFIGGYVGNRPVYNVYLGTIPLYPVVSSMELVFRIPSDDLSLTIEPINSPIDATIDWGDGTSSYITSHTSSELSHSYSAADDYLVRITGLYSSNRIVQSTSEKNKLISVLDLGQTAMQSLNQTFRDCVNLVSFAVGSGGTNNTSDTSNMFFGCSSLTTVDFTNFNTSNTFLMNAMFWGCSSLTSLDLSDFDTSNVRDMRNMFVNCTGLTSIDVSSFETSEVLTMESMFFGCSSITTIDLSNFDTTSVRNMSSMFHNCSGLTTIDVSSFDTTQVQFMNSMFQNCSNLTTLDLSNFVCTRVLSVQDMLKDSINNISRLPILSPQIDNFTNPNSFVGFVGGDETAVNVTGYAEWLANANTIEFLANSVGGDYWRNKTADFGASVLFSNQTQAIADRSKLINDLGWTINDGGIIQVG